MKNGGSRLQVQQQQKRLFVKAAAPNSTLTKSVSSGYLDDQNDADFKVRYRFLGNLPSQSFLPRYNHWFNPNVVQVLMPHVAFVLSSVARANDIASSA